MAELDIAINPSRAEHGANIVKRAINDIKAAARGVTGDLTNLGGTLSKVMGTGPALFATGLAGMTAASIAAGRSTASHIAELQKFALQTNLSTREAQLFSSMARQTGTEMNALSGGMGKLNDNLQEAAKGSGDSQRLFAALGVSVKDSNGKVRDTGKVFEDVIGKLGDFQNDSAKTTVISKLLGDEMQQMARIGREGFKNLSAEAKLMNAILGDDSVQAAEKFNQHIARTGAILEAWKLAIGEKVLPVLNSLLEGMNKLFTGRDLPAMGTLGKGAEGNKSLALPPDPAVLRRMLEERTKQQADAMTREVDLFNSGMDKEIAAMKRAMASREDMSTTVMDLINAEHQNKMSALINEENKIKTLIELEKSRFAEDQQIGGVSDDERRLRALQHQGTLAELESRLRGAKQKTGIQALLFDADEFDAQAKLQEDLGRRITDSLIATYQIGEDLRHREQDETLKFYDAKLEFERYFGTSRENLIKTQYDQVRAFAAKELDVTEDTATKVVNALRNRDYIYAQELVGLSKKTAKELEAIFMNIQVKDRRVGVENSGDPFAGLAEGMKRYVNDNSMFGFGVDQARRIAQGMEQAFSTFFFDAMEGRIRSFQDVVQGVVDFSQKILSDVAGKLATNMLLSAIAGPGAGGMFGFAHGGVMTGRGSLPLHRYAAGGIANRAQIALFGEGSTPEAYVPLNDGRTIPVTMKMTAPGQYAFPEMPKPQINLSVPVEIYNNTDAKVEVSRTPAGTNGIQGIKILIDQAVESSIASGRFDPAMRSRYGQRPALTRR